MREINLDLITDVTFDCIDHRDAPDYSDAYISYAVMDGIEMSDEEIMKLETEYPDWVYEELMNYIH